MFGLGPSELIIIAIIVLLVFGGKRLPEIGKGLGGAIREFRNVKQDLSPEPPPESPQKEGEITEKNNPPSLEAKVANKILEQVPAGKKAIEVGKKAKKIKDIIN